MLAIWPLIAVYCYKTKSITEATLWTVIGGYMFMPVRTSVDLPMIPPLDKDSIPALAAFGCCRLLANRQIPIFRHSGALGMLILLLIGGQFISAQLNADAIRIGGRVLPGLSHYDALSSVINCLINLLPFFLGLCLFKTYEHHVQMFKVLVIAGLVYSVLMLFEVRMSPQLHRWVYGYFPHSFAQQIRFGGFRPVVFMGHGLWVAFFTVVIVASAAALAGIGTNKVWRFSLGKIQFYFLLLLLACKSVASLVYGFFGFTLIRFFSIKMQFVAARALVIIALLYPLLCVANLFPHDKLLDLAQSVSVSHQQSLQTRFSNEATMLTHAQQRFFWGWGGWGRNRIYNEETGENESITDGRWIITFGQYGFMGFIAEFGILALSVFSAIKSCRLKLEHREKCLLAAHCLMIALVLVDQIPNATLDPWLWLLVGILLGRSNAIEAQQRSDRYTGTG